MQKIYRLRKGFQFNYIYRKGESVAGREMVIKCARNRNGRILIGVSVSKKIGKANIRNKVKRQFKESMRDLIPVLDKRYNYVLVARADAVTSSYQDINKTMKYLLKKVGKLKDEKNIHEKNISSDNKGL